MKADGIMTTEDRIVALVERLRDDNKALRAALESLVDHIAGDQHDEREIDSAFSLKGLGYRIAQARRALAATEAK